MATATSASPTWAIWPPQYPASRRSSREVAFRIPSSGRRGDDLRPELADDHPDHERRQDDDDDRRHRPHPERERLPPRQRVPYAAASGCAPRPPPVWRPGRERSGRPRAPAAGQRQSGRVTRSKNGRPDRHLPAGEGLHEQRVHRPHQDRESEHRQQQVVEQKHALPAGERLEPRRRRHEVDPHRKQSQGADDHHAEEPEDGRADGRLGEAVHGEDDARPGEEGAQDGERERGDDEGEVPRLEHSAPALDHGRVEERSRNQPGQETRRSRPDPTPSIHPSRAPRRTTTRRAGCRT